VPALSISSGQQIPGVPRWSADLSAQFRTPVTPTLAGFATADWNYVGASHGTVGVTDPDYVRPSYTVAGLTADHSASQSADRQPRLHAVASHNRNIRLSAVVASRRGGPYVLQVPAHLSKE
jgi:hypothetical protein